MLVHNGCYNSKIFQEIQENDIRGNDDVSTEYAYARMERERPSQDHL
jgi:hypothetical protein